MTFSSSLPVDQIPLSSDSCKAVNYEGVTYVEINGYLYPIDPEFSEPVSVPAEEHPRPSRKCKFADRLERAQMYVCDS